MHRLPQRSPEDRVYGLDIETDTRLNGLDPAIASIVAVAVATADGEQVFAGPEPSILRRLASAVRQLNPGTMVTWFGSGFDLPFLEERAARLGVDIGLRLNPERNGLSDRWQGHDHIDAYRVYRNDLPRLLDVSCSLKSVAGLIGCPTVVEDRARIHELGHPALVRYVASDARLARTLALRRWATAVPFADQLGG